MIRIIEEHALNAWPALQTNLYDGWVLRFAEGYSRRANSVNPVYESRLNPAEKITQCEAIYAAQGLPPIFRITPLAQPTDLDARLAARGYQQDALTGVWLLEDVEGITPPADDDLIVQTELTDAWAADFAALNRVDPARLPTMQRMLTSIRPAHAFLTLRVEGQAAAVALAVVDRGYLGIFDLVAHPELRGQGLGKRMLAHTLAWGCAQDACRAYLQVMLNNAPAMGLYTRFGFQELYRYWYRVPA